MIIFALAGTIVGIFAGLLPGIHGNTIASFLLFIPFLGEDMTVFLLSMGIAQALTEFVPSLFLGAPNETTSLAVHPAQQLLLEGKALEAICCTTFGGVLALGVGTLLTPLWILCITQNYELLFTFTPLALVFALLLFVLHEPTFKKKMIALFVVSVAGLHGLTFTNHIFSLITGYFGVAGALCTLKEKPIIRTQLPHARVSLSLTIPTLQGMLGGALVALLPGIGGNTAGRILTAFRTKTTPQEYLALIGGIAVGNFFFAFPVLIVLQKARNGVMQILATQALTAPVLLSQGILCMLLAGGLAGISAILCTTYALPFFTQKRIQTLTLTALGIMICLTFIFEGISGLFVLLCTTSLGLYTILTGIRRSTCMSALIVPVLFFYCFILF